MQRSKIAAVIMSAVLACVIGAPVVRADDDSPPTTMSQPEVTISVVDSVAPEDPPVTSETPDVTTEEPTTTEAPSTTEASNDAVVADSVEAPVITPAASDEEVPAVTTTEPDRSTHDASQDVTVSGTQVAISNSGGNDIVNDVPVQEIRPSGENSLDTGNATAIGSRDVNNVAQTADIVLADNAVANILQLALILNVGAALANSGVNGILSTPDGVGQSGVIGTGNANAVGNDAGQYALQAANGAAAQGSDDSATQNALSLWMGLALSNSGLNAINGTGTAGTTGGDIGAGSATAIGNDSLTDIGQHALANGSGDSVINIAQRAAVLNLGFALANSGLNDISGAAGALLAANDDNDDAISEQLFTMLLPALLQANGFGGGFGSVGTGDASATGNKSQTYIQQIAAATASGDGIASIAQDIIIANVGAAGANTGGNQLGRSFRDLTPDQATAVVSLAAFLSAMLAQVHGVMSGKALAMADNNLDVPFGDLVLQINGRLSGFDTTKTQGGTQANIHQITIIISLGVSHANTGRNAVGSINNSAAPAVDPNAPAIVSTDAVSRQVEFNTPEAANQIQAGNTDAVNTNLVIICQRIQADSISCLRPPDPPAADPGDPGAVDPRVVDPPAADPGATTTTQQAPQALVADPVVLAPVPAVAAVGGATADPLPTTGYDFDIWIEWSLVLVGLGAVLVIIRRRPGVIK